jgi:aryl-alcohol dehydrogenase-like predicted oxidoreductase
MQYQQLGRVGLFVSRLGFGTATFGGADHPLYGAIGGLDQAAADQLVRIALDGGVNLFDTADIYAGGESEQRLGRALRGRRSEAVIATKVGNRHGPGPNEVGHSRGHLLATIEASLRRLETDYIDLLQLHTFDPLSPLDDVLRTLDDAVRSGKVRYLGCSNFFAWQLLKAQGIAAAQGVERIASLQAYYSVASRDIEREIIPALQDQQMGLLTWCPLSAGLLTGKYTRSKRPNDNSRRLKFSFPPVDEEHGYKVIDALDAVASRHGATVAQVALAWQFCQPAVTAAIVGARSAAQLQENLKSTELHLTPEDLQQIDMASRLTAEYPRWYQDLPLGRRPGEGSGIGKDVKR